MLKMDIEGVEFDWIKSISDNQLNNIKQILIEIHFNPFTKFNEDKWNIIEKLSKTHYLVHIHGNNYSDLISINNLVLPETIECTFIRKKDIEKLDKINFQSPTSIDIPNNSSKYDLRFVIPNNL
jgi:hypothetical protein